MDTIELVARNGDTVRQAIELGDILHIGPESEELTDEFLLFAINSAYRSPIFFGVCNILQLIVFLQLMKLGSKSASDRFPLYAWAIDKFVI